MTDCPAMRQGDEAICTRAGCGLRWGLDEDRPECLMARRVAATMKDGPYSSIEPGLIGYNKPPVPVFENNQISYNEHGGPVDEYMRETGLVPSEPDDFKMQLAELRERIDALEKIVADIRNTNVRLK